MSAAELAEALRLAERGDWHGAHGIVQQDEADPVSCWIHAVLHRQEGDLANARYWYGRCGRRLRKGVAPDDELAEIRATLGTRQVLSGGRRPQGLRD